MFESGTVTHDVEPLNESALLNFPPVTQVVFETVPLLFLPDWSATVVPVQLAPWLESQASWLPMFLTTFVTFGYTCGKLSVIGLNTDRYAPQSEQQRFNARLRETWRFFPISASVVVLAWPTLCVRTLDVLPLKLPSPA